MDRRRHEDIPFFFNVTAATEIYTLSLHDALPISQALGCPAGSGTLLVEFSTAPRDIGPVEGRNLVRFTPARSEEHTSELQSRENLVCRLLLEKKKRSRPQI